MTTERLRLGLVTDGPGGFVRELLHDWESCYQVHKFAFTATRFPFGAERLTRLRLRHALERFASFSDVVFFEWAGPLLVRATQLPRRAEFVVRLHSYELFLHAEKVNWQSVRKVVLVSRAMERRLCDLRPELRDRTCVVHNGVDCERFGGVRPGFGGTIGMLCNIVPLKRIYEMILCVHELRRAGCNVNLKVGGPVGDGEDRRYFAAIQRLIDVLGLSTHVTFLGAVDDAAAFLHNVDIFVSNSYWEGQQVALLEAMAAGCYCLAHAWDGAEEVLPSDCLCLSDRDLMARISAFCDADERHRRRLGEGLAMIARERFGIDEARRKMRTVIEEASFSGRRVARGAAGALRESGVLRRDRAGSGYDRS